MPSKKKQNVSKKDFGSKKDPTPPPPRAFESNNSSNDEDVYSDNSIDSEDEFALKESKQGKMASSTQIGSEFANDTIDNEVVEKIRVFLKAKYPRQSYRVCLKILETKRPKIPGVNIDYLPVIKDIIHKVKSIRTLDEILADYKENQQIIEKNIHPDRPKKPTPAHFQFSHDHRDEIAEILKKTGQKYSAVNIAKASIDKFYKLPKEEQKFYTEQYESKLKTYQKNLEKFNSQHHIEKCVKQTLDDPEFMTPFALFYKDVEGTVEGTKKIKKVQLLWRELSDEEKVNYIHKLMEMDCKKKFLKTELKLHEDMKTPGLPKKPLTSYQLFYREYYDLHSTDGKGKELMKEIGEEWKKLSEEKRQKYKNKYQKEMEIWRINMNKYITKRPELERSALMVKYNLFGAIKLESCDDSTDTDAADTANNSKKKSTKNGEKKNREANKSLKDKQKFSEYDDSEDESEKHAPIKLELLQSSISDTDAQVARKRKKKQLDTESSSQEIDEPQTPNKKPKTNEKISESFKLPQQKITQEIVVSASPKKKNRVFDDTSDSESSKVFSSIKESKKKTDKKSTKNDLGATATDNSEIDSQTPLKRKKNKKDKQKIDEPEFPSQTTAHYFMTKSYEGKPKASKIAKAYRNLNPGEKKALRMKMINERSEYLNNIKEYFKLLDKDEIADYQKRIQLFRKEQLDAISWHTDNGTDTNRFTQSSSSESEDSD